MTPLSVGRIIWTGVLLSLIAFHLQSGCVNAAKRRKSTQKASRAEIGKINRLLNEQVQREIQQDATVQFDDAKAVEDPVSHAQFLLLADEARLSGNRHADELRVNNPDDYFHGDIDLTEWQALRIHRHLLEKESDKVKTDETEGSGLRHRWKRKIGRRRAINFDFADSVPLPTRQKIREALSIWQRTTCLRFREGGPDVDRLEFFDGGGCSSFVGRTGGTQGISISTPGCDYVGIIAHEIGHALGIFHEQARPDQRQHITVHYQNIPISRWNNFHPIGDNQVATYSLPYDAGSVMHYGPFGFATDPYRPTISTVDRNLQTTIGQRVEPSFLDIQSINEAYDCYSHCGSSNERLNCTHGGYPNPNDCTRCVCPSGFGGKLCAHVQASECGGVVELSRTAIYINSPNYPGVFPYNKNCIWLLKAPSRSGVVGKITLEFVDNFQYRCEDSTTCDKSYVEVKTGPDFRVTGYRFCCSIIPTQPFESADDEMIVMHSARDDEPQRGFRAKVWWSGGNDEDSLPDSKSSVEKPARVFPALKSITRTAELVSTETSPTTTDRTERRKATETVAEITEIEIIPESVWSKMTEIPISGQFGTTSATTVTPFTWPLFTFGTTSPATLTTTKPPIESAFGTTNFIGLPGEVMQTKAPLTITRSTASNTTPYPITPVPPVEPLVTDNCDTKCGAWSAWTDCNQLCGGCGRRSRKRACANQPPPTLLLAPSSSTSDCRTEERRPCNFDACPTGTNFLFNNAEFHILWKGCCVGMFRRNSLSGLVHSQDARMADQCAPLESGENAFIRIISSLLTAQDTRNSTKHGNAEAARRVDSNNNNISTSLLLRRLASLGHLTGKVGVDRVPAVENNRGLTSSNGFETED